MDEEALERLRRQVEGAFALKHGGRIAVDSRVGRGTTVTLRFPATDPGAQRTA